LTLRLYITTEAATINTTTARFTDELGGQTYANDIVLDWSTWNGVTILGYSRVNIATGNTWEQAIDNSLTYSLGTFTSNWRLSNIKEIINILNYQNTRTTLLDYAPLNLSSTGRVYWSSTTVLGSTTCCAYTFTNVGQIVTAIENIFGVNITYIPVRTFSLINFKRIIMTYLFPQFKVEISNPKISVNSKHNSRQSNRQTIKR
jgi:hypothetical protein